MATMNRTEVAKWLAEHDNFVILTHRRPDGDTVGSAAALCLGLRQLGKTAHVLVNAEVTPKYTHLLDGLTKVEAWAGDTVICVDVASFNMLPEYYQKYTIALRIDHHGGSQSFTENELVDPDASACGDIIYDILMALYLDLDTPIANALYTAVSTDTGCFRYANTNSHAFAVAAACAWTSPDIFKINQALFDTISLARLKVQAYLVAHTQFLQSGKGRMGAEIGRRSPAMKRNGRFAAGNGGERRHEQSAPARDPAVGNIVAPVIQIFGGAAAPVPAEDARVFELRISRIPCGQQGGQCHLPDGHAAPAEVPEVTAGHPRQGGQFPPARVEVGKGTETPFPAERPEMVFRRHQSCARDLHIASNATALLRPPKPTFSESRRPVSRERGVFETLAPGMGETSPA